jgi:hypothetical protein
MMFFGLMFNRHEPHGTVRLGSDAVRARSILGRIERIEGSMCQYSGLAVEPTSGRLASIEQPSSPFRSGESATHFTGDRSAALTDAAIASAARSIRLICAPLY